MYIWDCKIAPVRPAVAPLPLVASPDPSTDPVHAERDGREAPPPLPPTDDALTAPSPERRMECARTPAASVQGA
jgi:hypothetical protein